MRQIGEESSFCLRKAVTVSGYQQIIQFQRNIVDAVDPVSQRGELCIEVPQILSHIVRSLDQLDHGIHHIHYAGSLVGGSHTFTEHFHHGVQPRVFHLKDIHHIVHINRNLIIAVLVRIGTGHRREFAIQIIQIIHACAGQIHCIGQIPQCGVQGNGIASRIQIEIIILGAVTCVSSLPVGRVIKFHLSCLPERKLSVYSQITGRIEAPVHGLLKPEAYLVQACPVNIHIPANILSCAGPALTSDCIVYNKG